MKRLALIFALLPGLALAAPLDTSLRPEPRPGAQGVTAAPATLRLSESIRPKDRPRRIERRAKRSETQQAETRTASVRATQTTRFTKKGSICGQNSIKGTSIAPIKGRIRGCGVAEPVRITSIQGVTLSTPSTMDCGTARALDAWVKSGVQPAVGGKGGGVARLQVAAHYICKTRNSQPGAKISEHGKGRAIDISAFVLADGTQLSVRQHWRSKAWGATMRQMHKAACGPFGTVLGPNADRFHQGHFHLDTARYRSGSYCR